MRQTILAATLRVLARTGWDDLTTRDVAAEAGINLALIHYYFESKRALLLAAADAFYTDLRERFLADAEGQDAVGLVRAMMRNARRAMQTPDGPARHRMMAEGRLRPISDPAFAPPILAYWQALRSEFVRRFGEAGVPPARAEALAVITQAFFEVYAPQRLVERETIDLDGIEREFLAMLECALQRPPDAGDGNAP
jgi:AcrR family transcriptional regulator